MQQPHEGIRGILRDDDHLLSLDDWDVPVRVLLVGLASHLHNATLVGNQAPKVAAMWRRMRSPQIGDLVAEMTARMPWSDVDRRVKGFGYLVAHREEWASTDEEWIKYLDDGGTDVDNERLTDDAWYVQYGPQPEDVCRWTNCSFIVVPTPDEQFRISPGQGAALTSAL